MIIDWTPAETWKRIVGEKTPEEFLRQHETQDADVAAIKFARQLGTMIVDFSDNEIDLIAFKLAEHIKDNKGGKP